MAKRHKKRDLNAEAGVNYEGLDPFKIACMQAAQRLVGRNLLGAGYRVLEWSRGESVFLVAKKGGHVIGFTIEGLGTKNQVPDMMLGMGAVAEELERLGVDPPGLWEDVAVCNANTVFNDMASLGVPPFAFNLFVAVGETAFLTQEHRRRGLIRGTAKACEENGASWGGGETQRLGDGQVGAAHAVLAGASWGIVDAEELVVRGDVRAGDSIVLLESTGLHANGYSTARGVARKVAQGMLAELPDGTLYGQALLAPTVSYSPFIQALIAQGVRPRYVVPMTGHGVRKLMRLGLALDYELVDIPEPQPVFRFIQEVERATDREMYETYNMGIGCAVIVRPKDTNRTLRVAEAFGRGIRAREGGGVSKNAKGQRRVVMPARLKMKPFKGGDLKIR